MKQLAILFFILISSTTYAQVDKIKFETGTLKQAIKKAKKEKKPIFLDFYADWCVPCKMMEENVFTDSEVANMYNKYFVNIKLDADRGQGKILADQYKVKVLPTLVFLDKKGSKLYTAKGALGKDGMLDFARKTIRKMNKKQKKKR